MKSLRFPLHLLGIFALVALLGGCGKSTTPTSVSDPPSDSAPLAAPTSLTYTIASDGLVTLEWAPSTDPSVSGYEVFAYSPSPVRDNSYVSIGRTDVGTPSLMLPGSFQHGIQYFRVQSYNAGGHSANSVTMQATLPVVSSGGGTGNGGGSGGHGRSE